MEGGLSVTPQAVTALSRAERPHETLQLQARGAVRWIRFDRDGAMNSFSPLMVSELHRALDDIQADPAARCVVLTGNGRAFCAGADLSAVKRLQDGGAGTGGADPMLAFRVEAFERIAQALARYQKEDPAFQPFSSKYDAVLRRQASLTPQEERGLALFKDEKKGNCAACHPADKAADGSHPLFTDFTYDNLGVPRNPELGHNAHPAFFDLGLCARQGGDLAARTELCGAFKVPSLRNVALRQALFHNGHFKNLTDALRFYVQRDTHPEKWYPRRADGSIAVFNDLPPALHGNVNTAEVPYDRKPGDEPALTEAEIQDVIAFLKTLTDGWKR